MVNYIITTDSACDMPKKFLEDYNVQQIPLYYTLNDVTYSGSDGIEIYEFYERMRNGETPTTMGCNPEKASEMFSKILEDGKDILHISFSSALSVSYNSAIIAADELREKYPERKILVIDSKAASLGEGLIVYKAVRLKQQGKSIEDNYNWIMSNLNHFCHYFTVDDLNHLHRGGRVSKATAVVGTLINIKPVLHVNNEGELKPLTNVRGRKKSINELVNFMEKEAAGYENDTVFIVHGDCEDDAKYLADKIKERFGIDNILINILSQTIGTHSGPGTLALFFMGEHK